MKKIFLFISALTLAAMASAATIEVAPGTNTFSTAVSNASAGDVLILTSSGEYTESSSVGISKNLVIKAAEGKKPILKIKIGIQGGARVEFQGIKFDASVASSHLIYANDDTEGNKMIFENCEFYNFTLNNSLIYCGSDKKLDSCIVDNCYFHDIKKSCLFFDNAGLLGLVVTNSTFANISTDATSYSAGVIDPRSTTAKVCVDHCTFYDVLAMSDGYGAVCVKNSPNIQISNNIFAFSTSTDSQRAVWLPDAEPNREVKNCLVYNYTKDSGKGIRSDNDKTNCIFGKDPLFTDAANGDFSFAGNWTTGNISPARSAATDGTDLGDPRWYTEEVIPEVDFSTPQSFEGTNALLDGYIRLNASNHIEYYDNSVCGTALWKIQVSEACSLRATLNMESGSSSGHRFKIEVLNENRVAIAGDSVREPKQNDKDGHLAMMGRLTFNAAGTYYLKLYNLTAYSSAILESFTLTPANAYVQTIPTTMLPKDALLSDSAWIEPGATSSVPDTINFKHWGDNKYNATEWAKWKFRVTTPGQYRFTANVTSTNGQYYTISVLNSAESSTITEKVCSSSLGTGDRSFSTDVVDLEAEDYVIKIVNTYANSKGRILNIVASYEGGVTVDIPAILEPADVILSPRAWVDKTGVVDSILFTPRGSEGYNDQEYAKWKVNVTKAGYYNFTANVCRPNGSQKFEIKVLSSDENDVKISNTNESISSGNQSISSGKVNLSADTYVIKVRNIYNHSESRLLNVVATYEGGAVVPVPGYLPAEEAVLEPQKMYRDANGYIHYNDNETPTDEYAYWKIHTTAPYSGKVILDIPTESTSGHEFHLELYSSLDGAKSSEAYETSTVYTGGLKELSQTFEIPAGDYFIKLINKTQYSSTILRGISLAPSITLDEAETATTIIDDNDGNVVNAQLTRSLVAGMYNTICLPFAVSAAEMGRVFPGAVVKELSSSSLEEGGYILNLNFSAVSEMAAGKPYLIKPAANVENPKFIGVTIDKTLRPTNTSKANFVGNFVKGTISADPNNLFLGAENTLYFPTAEIDILGMRAYFVVHDAPAGMIKRARIVENEQILTDIELVRSQEPILNSQKLIESGQLIIVRDGVRYNALGIKLQ